MDQYSPGNWQFHINFNTKTSLASAGSKQMSISSFKPCSITCCLYRPKSRYWQISYPPLDYEKRRETFVHKSWIFGFYKMHLQAFLQSKQWQNFIVCAGRLQHAGKEGMEILQHFCPMRAEHISWEDIATVNIQASCSLPRSSNQIFPLIWQPL